MARSCPVSLALTVLMLSTVSWATADADSATSIADHTLPNGMRVTLVTDPLTDLAAFHLAIETAVPHEPPELAALPELIQQLLLDRLRTRIVDGNHIAGLSDALAAGASVALSAGDRYVEAEASLPASLLPAVLTTISELFFASQQFTDEELATARQKLVSSYEASLTSTAFQTLSLLERALGTNSVPGYDVATILSVVGQATLDDVQSARQRLYVPSRACLTVIGPEPHEQLLEMVNQAVGNYPAGDLPTSAATIRLPGESSVRVGNGSDIPWASMMIGVPLPPYASSEFVVGQVAYMLLAGPEGRLTEDPMLRRGFGIILPQRSQGTASAFEAMPPRPAHMPFIAVHTVAAPGYVEQARVRVLGHIEALRQGEFTEEQLQTARTQLANQYALAYDTCLSRAQLVNFNALFGGEPGLRDDFTTMVAAVKSQDVVRLAEKYFAHHAIGLQMPGD